MIAKTRVLGLGVVLATTAIAIACRGDSTVAAGQTLFRQRCAVCHGQNGEGAQGPSLRGVSGRKAGGDPQFGYTRALTAATLTWDAPALDRFLTAPRDVVPGTNMVLATGDPGERKVLIAYLLSLPAGPPTEAERSSAPVVGMGSGLRVGPAAFGDYRSDAPGVRRRVTVADLPKPFATESARNNAKIVAAPDGAALHVPDGFQVALFAKDLTHPRLLRVAPDGDVFVAASDAGEVQVLRAAPGAAPTGPASTFIAGLDDPFGIAFYPAGPSPEWIYVAEANVVRRYPYRNGDLTPRGPGEIIVPQLSPSTGGHTMRSLAFSLDGKTMFVAVGSGSNVAEDVERRAPDAIASYEAAHGPGATWGTEEDRADVLAFDPAGGHRRVFATGIRNCSGLTIQPAAGEVWCSTNERDKLGDDLVPDYVTRVRDHAFYGWPWYYLGDHEDPRHAGERTDLVGKIALPDVLLQPHSAPLQLTFYDGTMFPAEYRGNVFVALHGSWNRGGRTGYKVVRVLVRDGVPTGEYEDFLTGFVADADHVWGRPVGVAVAADGALLVSDDGNGTIWRVSHP